MDWDSRQEICENGRQYNVYVNQDKFYDVPQGWVFPKCTLIEGWSFWCIDQPSYLYTNLRGGKVRAPIRPFVLFWTKKLPRELKNKWEVNFKPVFEKMTGDDSITIPTTIVEAYLKQYYRRGLERLRFLSPWIFYGSRKSKPEAWLVSQWSKFSAKGHDHEKAMR